MIVALAIIEIVIIIYFERVIWKLDKIYERIEKK